MLRRFPRLNTPFFKRFQSTFKFQIDQNAITEEFQQPLAENLKLRGLIGEVTNENYAKLTETEKLTLYSGADPTAKSLHLGNLLPLLILLHFNIRGHDVIGLIGGATGKVGDPSGRNTERSQILEKIRLENIEKIKTQMFNFLHNGNNFVKTIGYPVKESNITIKNNYDWLKDISLLDFLSIYGKYIRVNSMINRTSVKSRLESEEGIGFNEFTYQLLQAFDFWHLYKNNDVTIQVGGGDQWGNITAGIELINKLKKLESSKLSKPVFGITVPLLTTASGKKFGKSAGNAIFIDNEITPSFELYNYFIKTFDEDIEKNLKIFTFIPLKQIESIIIEHYKKPSLRIGQRILAKQITELIFGKEELEKVLVISSILYPLPGEEFKTDYDINALMKILNDAKLLIKVERDQLGKNLITLLKNNSKFKKNELMILFKQGSIYHGLERKVLERTELSEDLLIENKLLMIKIGKSQYLFFELV